MRKGFTLFEVLVSLIILSIVLVSISKLLIENDNLNIYQQLQKDENSFILNGLVSDSRSIKYSSKN